MQRLEAVATRMRRSLMRDNGNPLDRITFLTGSKVILETMGQTVAKEPFSAEICDFLSDVSKTLLKDKRSRQYSDVVTFAFWIREASIKKLKERFKPDDKNYHLGRGLLFHIAPSNVPTNFAYSLTCGLLAGNANIVRVPTKEFPQIRILVDAFNEVLSNKEAMKSYVLLCQYGREKEINDALSQLADVRIVWGGNKTISELRQSPLPPRSTEITFADRYSLAVIDSDKYMAIENKDRIARDFYNDTYFSDQNACTSPRTVIWHGGQKKKARNEFWKRLYNLVKEQYNYQSIMGVDKLTYLCLSSVDIKGIKLIPHKDNLLIRAETASLNKSLMDHNVNCGFCFEYECDDPMELWDICNDKRCQTIVLLGDKSWLCPLFKSGIKGVDRITDIGKSMDFDLVWDGSDLISLFTRTIPS